MKKHTGGQKTQGKTAQPSDRLPFEGKPFHLSEPGGPPPTGGLMCNFKQKSQPLREAQSESSLRLALREAQSESGLRVVDIQHNGVL